MNPYANQYRHPGYQVDRQMMRQQHLNSLRHSFPNFDMSVIEGVYLSFGENFQQTSAALQDMNKTASDEVANRKLTPEVKLEFMKMVFDRLDPPYIASVLKSYQWSVEAALDELLVAEASRSEAEELQRRKMEEERRRREEEARRIIVQRQLELERMNNINRLLAEFPKLGNNAVTFALQSSNWNVAAARATLSFQESQRAQNEADERRRQEERMRQEAIRRVQEEEKRLKEQTERLKLDQLHSLVQNAKSWDEVVLKLDHNIDNPEENFHVAQVDVLHQYLELKEEEIRPILVQHEWNVESAMDALEALSYSHFSSKMAALFPNVSAIDLESVCQRHYPSEGRAIDRLRNLQNNEQKTQLLRDAIQQARQRLTDALKRQAEFDVVVSEIKGKRKMWADHLQQLSGTERAMMEAAHDMLKQKQDLQIREGTERHAKEVEMARKEVNEAEEALTNMVVGDEASTTTLPVPEHLQSRSKLRSAILHHTQQAKQQVEMELRAEQSQRQTRVAQRLKEQLGDGKFAALQEAIGRAPGGVAAGFWVGKEKERSDRSHHSTVNAADRASNDTSRSSSATTSNATTNAMRTLSVGSTSPPSSIAHSPYKPPNTNPFSSPTLDATVSYTPTPQELKCYDYYFLVADGRKTGYIGKEDADFFYRAQISKNQLFQIWSLASGGTDRLTRSQFYLALRLIAQAQNNLSVSSIVHSSEPIPFPRFSGLEPPNV